MAGDIDRCVDVSVLVRVQVKALLQEMANFEDARAPPISQYQSMYDMVKRWSNKEREKEDNLRAMESRAKSLNQIAQVLISSHNVCCC